MHILILSVLATNLEPEPLHLLGVPAADEVALVAVVLVDRVAHLDVVCEAAHRLRVRPLQAVCVVAALGAARAGVAVRGPVVGHRRFREVVPPVAAVGFFEVRVRVGEEGGEDEGFLVTEVVSGFFSLFVSGDKGKERKGATNRVVRPRALPSPELLHLFRCDAVQRQQWHAPPLLVYSELLEILARERRRQRLEVRFGGVEDGVCEHHVAGRVALDLLLVPGRQLGEAAARQRWEQLLDQALRQDEARAAVREAVVGRLGRRPRGA